MSESYNPWLNIATEEWIFEDLDPNLQTLYLWRNEETVVIGRSQNPWSECNLKKMEEDGVCLSRRATGGGAVFHDLGNTNFTFLSSKEKYDKTVNSKIIIGALEKFGVQALISGRNDIVVPFDDSNHRKISGSAFRESQNSAFHHGTLLVSTNLTKLGNYLTPNPKKLISNGVTSTQARVMNLNELNKKIEHKSLSDEIIHQFFKFYQNDCKIEFLDEETLEQNLEIKKKYDKFSNWDWRFGKTPKFSQEFSEYLPSGSYQVYFSSSSGVFSDIQIYSDCLYPDVIEEMTKNIKFQKISYAGLRLAVDKTKKAYENDKKCIEVITEVFHWLSKCI